MGEGDKTHVAINSSQGPSGSSLALISPNKILFCYMTSDRWGPSPPGWTVCRILSVVGNAIQKGPRFTLFQAKQGGDPGDVSSSETHKIEKVSATKALICRLPVLENAVQLGKS